MKIVTVSDTHGNEPELPEGDLLIHSGDFTKFGFRSEFFKQLCWIDEQREKFKHIVVTPGNHDFFAERHLEEAREACLAAGAILLVNEYVVIDGHKIYGSPVTPTFHDWAFNLNSYKIDQVWEQIPLDTSILVTHGPPYGILDKTHRGEHLGCPELLNRVKEIKPKLHIFGHVHESYGTMTIDGTKFVNAAVGHSKKSPIIVEL